MFPRPGKNGVAGIPEGLVVVVYAYNVTVSPGFGTPSVPPGAPNVLNKLTGAGVKDVSVNSYPSVPELL